MKNLNPSIEIVAIGNEVLSGQTMNSNAAFMSLELTKIGHSVLRHLVLPDDPLILKSGLQEAMNRSEIILCTGGLGSTCDDVTRQVAADLFQSGFTYHEEIAEELKKRYAGAFHSLENFSTTLTDQATLPDKAKLIPNPLGSAKGLIFQEGESTLILMPGVPHEMRTMFSDHVLPYLQVHFPLKKRIFGKFLHFFQLPEAAIDPSLRELKGAYPAIDFGIYPGLGIVTVNIKAWAEKESEAQAILEPIVTALSEKFSENIFESSKGRIQEAIQHLFVQKKYTLSTAESCTGGAIAASLVQEPGASEYFLGSIVSYDNSLKVRVLGVNETTLENKGAVSQEVVREMVTGVLKMTGSDFAVAVTGIAGPTGGTTEKPVGTVWAAVGFRGEEPEVWRFLARGSRSLMIERSINIILSRLYSIVKKR